MAAVTNARSFVEEPDDRPAEGACLPGSKQCRLAIGHGRGRAAAGASISGEQQWD
jgi:hypothetical protein